MSLFIKVLKFPTLKAEGLIRLQAGVKPLYIGQM